MRELFDPDGPGSSPHTRGARSSPTSHRSDGRIIPAYAGSTGLQLIDTALYMDHPRIRGEHASTANLAAVRRGSSPHTRGARKWEIRLRFGMRIIPAYAGSTRCRSRRRGRSRDHPRIRGEHDLVVAGDSVFRGSSPHTRGAPDIRNLMDNYLRIIPAYAGSTPSCSGVSSSGWDHPRIRGEHFDSSCQLFLPGGSSPHTRGALIMKDSISKSVRIIPAYAGSTSMSTMTGVRITDHPRIRGEHLAWSGVKSSSSGSSPHTRGARPPSVSAHVGVGIIPAYAGSTGSLANSAGSSWDHPRIRGEHSIWRWHDVDRVGSSPHTRGARAVRQPLEAGSRIIPAYAGSTTEKPST